MKFYPPGTRIAGRYEIASHPLMGGMGIVYVCLDHEENRPVALKTFKPELLPDRAARDRFLREGTAWVDLGAHPHVVRCYQVFRLDPEVYLVLELVAKEQGRDDASLRSWLTPGVPLPVEQALLFALQIACGMAHATATMPGFVHRDLKPENVLVGADHLSQARVNRVRVTDFGLAAVLQEASQPVGETAPDDRQGPVRDPLSRTQLTHGIVGTPLYMAPEQWRGERVDMQADVYALGCMLYEMVAGQRAVAGSSLAALRRAHCQGEVRPLPRDLSAAVGQVLARCLALEAGERYGSWEAVEAALVGAYEEVVGHPAPAAEPVTTLSRAERVAVGWSYNAMGASYLDIGKAEVAVTYFERALKVGQTEEEQRLTGAGLNSLGLAHRALGQFSLAVEKIEQALHIAREIGDQRGEGATLNNLGTCYRRLGKHEDALACHKQRLSIAHQIGDRAGEGAALNGLGSYYEEMGQPDMAIGYHQQHLDIARTIGNRTDEATALNHLGICYLLLEQIVEAMHYHQQALDVACEIGDLMVQGRALSGLGQCYFKIDPEKAVHHFRQALSIAREINDRQGVAAALGALAVCLYGLRQWDEAERMLRESLEISDEMGTIRTSGGTCLMLARLMAQQERPSEALPLAERAVQIFTRIGSTQHTQQAQRLVAEIRAALR